MTYRITILRRAQFDVDSIVHYIAIERESPQGANSWLRAYERALDLLPINPNGYALAAENRSVNYELRQFLFKTKRGRIYRGVFTLIDKEIRILRIRGPGQPPLGPDELTD